ncbi:heavy-metal-associated domain-containing protein [Streptococcus hyointestinalis]|uniref:Copper chaperone n=1 Tax=Streptococcus hyointestinalis TaxID=1337 RepID=A0A380K7U7_9STRE|nr:heavy-metal-associated domain-containing protein [Streptococcus hyointestinalis]MCI6871967.1 heavy-metal-associated domain-containing protein [Streptococcus hyointestinalis]MDD6384626.1 heavy-metal-associated domain-containing protein [Streptococcus hyointestinalis]MDD7356851.1 heavy-metal-associated domain-containing protein [Streptococcus hyointestinalis]MDY4553207.1 heavy-metal-associated domain-containing protein [Streptococcus hyointestinalis]SUN60206.1 copper chaperone [Streptococcus 
MEKTYQVSGMKCEGCANTVTEKLSAVRGVEKVDVNLEKGQVTVTGKPFKLSLKRALKDTKYELGDEV